MKFKLRHFLILFGVFASFLPVVAVDVFLDNYIRKHSMSRFQEVSNAISEKNQNTILKSIASLDYILKSSPSLCTPTFVKNVQMQLQVNSSLSQVIVENKDKVQYCDGYNGVVNYTILSNPLPMPNRSETIRIVQLENNNEPSFMITRKISSTRIVSIFLHINYSTNGVLPDFLAKETFVELKTTDGGNIFSAGKRYSAEELADNKNIIAVKSVATALPIITSLVIPLDVVRASFSGMNVFFTVLVAFMSAIILLLAMKNLKKSNLPAIDLERAVEQEEFVPYYQPVINIKTGRLVGCEALMRWVKKNGEVVAPGMFIDYAESSGLAFPMTISLMKRVVKDLEDLCGEQPDIKIGINLFEGHFRDTSIVDDIKAIFGGSKIKYNQLVFEITERKPLGNQLAVNGVITGLKSLGCKIAMDDAGTGHSNLAYIQTLNVDIIKIDKVFVDMIGPETNNVPILDGLIAIAKDLGAGIVAEGIENQDQIRYLKKHGVLEVQGFLFSPALRFDDFISLARGLNLPPKVETIASDIIETAA